MLDLAQLVNPSSALDITLDLSIENMHPFHKFLRRDFITMAQPLPVTAPLGPARTRAFHQLHHYCHFLHKIHSVGAKTQYQRESTRYPKQI